MIASLLLGTGVVIAAPDAVSGARLPPVELVAELRRADAGAMENP